MLNLNIRKSVSLKSSFTWLSTLGFVLFTHAAAATPFANPLPAVLLDDLDGTGYFDTTGVASVAIEVFDLGDTISEFGFYEQGSPGTLIPIFEAADLSGEAAIVDFAGGFVIDFEMGLIQNMFAAPTSPIGFYFSIPNQDTLFSDPTLNPAGLDFTAAHPSIAGDSTDILFWTPDVPGIPPPTLLSWHRILGVTGVPVPTPSSIALLMLGLAVMARRKKLV